MIGATAVRHATEADVPALGDALGRAFLDDPVMRWFFPDDGRRAAYTRRFFRLRVQAMLAQDEVYTTDDHAGAAVWAQPGRWEAPPLASLMFVLRVMPMVGRRAPTLLRGWSKVDAAHPAEPHYYLAILGTDPDAQGRGVGSALIQPVLDDCDRNEIPAYLESSNPRNHPFYARHGFRITGDLVLPKGPRIWTMWREPLV